jgi:polyhydroxyalkanoate synthesis regulator phasin
VIHPQTGLEEEQMAAKASGSKSSRSGTRKKSTAKRASSTRKRTTSRSASARRAGSRSASAGRADKSVQQFREALERSITIPRERVQEVVDDAVKRGRMTRKDANELVSKLVSRGRKQTDTLLRDLEKLLDQARKDFDTRTVGARREAKKAADRSRKQAKQAADRVGRAARDAADRPLAEADRLRRRAGGPGFPITAYDQLTAAQVKTRLTGLTKAELRKVRTREKNSQARKGVLDTIDKKLK